MINELHDEACLAELQGRLAKCQASAPAHGLISITLDLGAGTHNWLPAPLDRASTFWWAQPAQGDFRLALGQALVAGDGLPDAGPNEGHSVRAEASAPVERCCPGVGTRRGSWVSVARPGDASSYVLPRPNEDYEAHNQDRR